MPCLVYRNLSGAPERTRRGSTRYGYALFIYAGRRNHRSATAAILHVL